MSEHTKTPWRRMGDVIYIGNPGSCDAETGQSLWGGFSLQHCPNPEANAKHIVHCVNNHERLTQALRQSGCPNAKSSESFGILSVSECCELFQTCDCGNSEVLAGLDAGEGGEV